MTNAIIRFGTGLCHVGVANTFLIIRTVSGTGIVTMCPGRTGRHAISCRLTLFLWGIIIRDTAGIATAISRRFVITELLPGTCPRIGDEAD